MSHEVTAAREWPIGFEAVERARDRIRPYLSATPLRRYPVLDALAGGPREIWVKHENHNPTGSFKARNALSAMTALAPEQRARGVVAATRGNHGLGLAWAGTLLGVPVTLCVPEGNNPEKNEGMRGFGAQVVEKGRDYDEAVEVADELVRQRGLSLVHGTNDPEVIAGAGTITLEILEQNPSVAAIVVGVGGGSQAVGTLTVARALDPGVAVYAVQAQGASAIHDSWHAGRAITRPTADTFADGLATRNVYPMTFGALREGLAGFVAVSEKELADAVRLLLRATHNLAEGAGAAPLAGLRHFGEALKGKVVAIVLSGGNMDAATLRRVVNEEI
jgi:threonine dehydratase